MENQNETKKCSKCGRVLPLSEFQKCSRNADGLQYRCKECQNKATRIRYARNTSGGVNKTYLNDKLKDITPRELIAELRFRGYQGELTYVQKIKV